MANFRTRTGCPVCDAQTSQVVFERPYDDARLKAALTAFYARVGGLDYEALSGALFRVLWCPECTLVYQSEIPDDHLLEQLYEEWINPELARTRLHTGHSPDQVSRLVREVAISASLLPATAPTRWLDYGCGWGEWSLAAQKLGRETWGTELSRTRRAHASSAGVVIVGDTELPDSGFGLINLDQVLEHVPQPRTTIALLAKKLHRDGVLRIAVPNGWRVRSALHRFDRELLQPRLGRLNPIAPLEHLNCFTTRSLERLASSCGLGRVRPTWSALWQTFQVPSGTVPKLKALAYPFYLRSARSTVLFFRADSNLTPRPATSVWS